MFAAFSSSRRAALAISLRDQRVREVGRIPWNSGRYKHEVRIPSRLSQPGPSTIDMFHSSSHWFLRPSAPRGSKNPELESLFCRLSKILARTIIPIFVFDGPKAPDTVLGRLSLEGGGLKVDAVKRMITAFGFQWIEVSRVL
jgi:hypothetical protein